LLLVSSFFVASATGEAIKPDCPSFLLIGPNQGRIQKTIFL
jgi:hypothetical protein